MAANVVVKRKQVNSCCAVLTEKRNALRHAVNLLKQENDMVRADNVNLKKAYEEERALVDIEREGKVKESAVRVSLENEISALKFEISVLKQKGGSGAQDGNEEVAILRARISEGETEINLLKELVEKEKTRADSERKTAEAEKKKAAEVWEFVKAEKRTDEEKSFVDSEGKEVEEYKIQLEKLKNEADEARSKLVLEISKTEEANKRLQAEKQKEIRQKKCADSEKAKAEEQRKLAEANRKKMMDEKCRADHLSQQLEEDRQRIKELQKEIHEILSSQKLVEAHAVLPDKTINSETVKMEDRLRLETVKREAAEAKLVVEFSKTEELTKRIEVEEKKVIREKKRADSEMAKAEEQRKLAEENRRKAMEEKSHADQLSQKLEEDRRRIEELQKEIHELVSFRKLAEPPAVPPDKNLNTEMAKMKLLKEKLKFEKMRVKHAKQVAKLEKGRNSILQQELGRLKLEVVQFSRRLDFLDNCFSHGIEGTDDLAKTRDFLNMQSLNLKRKLSGIEPFQMYLQSEHGLVPNCMAMHASDHFRHNLKCTASLLPISGGNCTESISGIDSKLESLLGGSDRKMLQSSAINSSTASFSDSQLVGSQERGAFSVTTSAKLEEENSSLQPTISKLSGEVTKMRYNETLAVVAENSVRSPLNEDGAGRVSGHGMKKKRILNAVESIEYMYSEGKKLNLQIEEKLLLLYSMLDRQMDKSFEEGRCLVQNLPGDSYANQVGFQKKRKVSHKQKVVNQRSCDSDEQKKAHKHEIKGSEDANFCRQATPTANNLTGSAQAYSYGASDSVMSDEEAMVSLEEVADGDYMKLLDLDNAVDEECYRVAREMPLSPSLPEIDFQSGEVFAADKSKHLVEDGFCDGLSNGKDNLLPSCSFDVINLEIKSNDLKVDGSGTSHNPLLHKNEGPIDPFENLGNKENGFCDTLYEGKACVRQILDSVAEAEMPNLSTSVDEGAKFQRERELKSQHDNIPEYCIVFSDTKDSGSISRIFHATRSCMARCSLVSHTDWVVEKILHAVALEDLLSKEKACVFFSLLLYNFSGTALKNFGNFLTRDSFLCLDSFSVHICAVMSDAETRSVFAELFHLDELLSLIEDFLIDGRVLVYNDLIPETSVISIARINILLDGVHVILSFEAASADQLVAGSIIFASICSAVDEIGFICEASYNIFRMHNYDSSLMLTILHVFAYLCGKKYFSLSNYSLIMMVIKSMVTFLERENLSVGTACFPFASNVRPELPPCSKCPFSEDAVSVDTAISLLLEMLQYYALPGNQDPFGSVNSLKSIVLSIKEQTEQSLAREEACGALDMRFEVPCRLNKFGLPATQLDSVFNGSLCHFIDALSLVELVACNMSWDWSYNKIVPHLLKILESCALENNSASIVILLGQLGRLGVDSSGYEDMGVENLRCRLSAFLCHSSNLKLGLPFQIATVSALLGLLSLDFENLIQSNLKLPAIASQSVTADLIRKWFSLLSNDQQSLSFSILQSVGINKK